MMEAKERIKMIMINYIWMCLIFGTTFLAIKIGVNEGMPPFLSAGLRFTIAGMILFGWMCWKGKAKATLVFRKEIFVTAIGLTFSCFAALYWAEQYISSGMAAVLSATGPIMIMLIQILFYRQRATLISMIGCGIGLIGVILLVWPSFLTKGTPFVLMGCLVMLIGELLYAISVVYSKKVMKNLGDTSPIALNAAQMLVGGVLLLLLSVCTEPTNLESFGSTKSIGSMLYLIIVGSMVGHSLFYWLITKTNPVFPSTWLYVSPLIAVLIGMTLYGEKVEWISWIGIFIVLVGIVLTNGELLKTMFKKQKQIVINET